MTKQAHSIDEFCASHDICRATLYNLWRAGNGPRSMRVGSRVLISVEAASDWRRQMEPKATRSKPRAA